MARAPAPKGQANRRQASRGATARKRQSKPTRAGLPGWLWGVAGLIAGFALAQYLQQSAPAPIATVVPKPASSASQGRDATSDDGNASDASGSTTAPESRMPTFEFYTLLPESEVIAPKVDESTTTAGVSTSTAAADDERTDEVAAAPSTDGLKYMLQAASFRNVADAKRLASRLQDFGLLAHITKVRTSDNQTWHRVQVGPYQDTRELSRAQDLMMTQGIDPLLIKLQN